MENHKNHQSKSTGHYKKLLIMAVLSFAAMYALMYSMVDSFANVFPNINQFYMAGLMTMPMVIIELCLMWAMYKNKILNALLIGISVGSKAPWGDKQFLKSMIPHHAGAILMCRQASLKDQEIKGLCKNILAGQQSEIDLMKAKLKELDIE